MCPGRKIENRSRKFDVAGYLMKTIPHQHKSRNDKKRIENQQVNTKKGQKRFCLLY